MFNLTEAFKIGYEEYLREQVESDFETAFDSLQESQKEAERSFEIVREYFRLYAISENLLEEVKKLPTMEEEKKSGSQFADPDSIKSLIRLLGDQLNKKDEEVFQPVLGNVSLQKITDMKFPQNIIFFLHTLITWLTNLVRKFISFFTNGVQRLFGLEPAKDFSGDLKLHLSKARAIETIAMPLYGSQKTPKPATAVTFDAAALEKVRNIFGLNTFNDSVLYEADERDSSKDRDSNNPKNAEFNSSKQVNAISIDISKDMEDLHNRLVYFLDLFDSAYGSNQEHLFETEDLQLLLELFKSTMEAVTSGKVPTFALQGKLTELEVINKERLYDNLIRTKINTDKLKNAYVDTQTKISQILQIISHKQIIAAEGMGVRFRFYSATTYVQMERIINVLEPRIKNAEKLEKKLIKMGEIFNKVVAELGKQRSSISNFSQVTYTSVYQRKINDLFDASRFVSQTITLRLATLGLYIKQLRDVRESIANANSINSRSKDFLKKEIFSGIRNGLFV